jgi:hypothetical protein
VSKASKVNLKNNTVTDSIKKQERIESCAEHTSHQKERQRWILSFNAMDNIHNF